MTNLKGQSRKINLYSFELFRDQDGSLYHITAG
jgi:hypothetical protein